MKEFPNEINYLQSYTSWNIKRSGRKARRCPADRIEHASRFRSLLADLGLTHPEAAQLLHVSLRTLHNWLSARHEVPYAAYKLLRLLRCMELPDQSWAGWHFSRGLLVAPFPVPCRSQTSITLKCHIKHRFYRYFVTVAHAEPSQPAINNVARNSRRPP